MQRPVLMTLSVLLAAATVVSVTVALQNRGRQQAIAERAQFIQQSVPLERLNQEMIRALAELSARNQDKDVTALLAANGITFNAQPTAVVGAPVSAPATSATPKGSK